MQEHCTAKGIALRPHAKTHKSARVAADQIALGAVGVCCATLAEAELLATKGIDDILLTSPVVQPAHIARLAQLNDRITSLACVVDNRDLVRIFRSVLTEEHPLSVLVDLDPGLHRTGIGSRDDAVALVEQLMNEHSLEFKGIQCYAGNLMHVTELGARRSRSLEVWHQVAEIVELLQRRGVNTPTITGGGTGTYNIDWESAVLTELQAGSYPFMDCEYHDVQWDAAYPPFEPSLFVLTSVVSNNSPGRATTDAGLKAFATDSVPPRFIAEHYADWTYRFLGDEHGCVELPTATDRIKLGTQLILLPPHCDPTINLYDSIHVVNREFEVIDQIEVTARSGRTLWN